MTDLTWVLIRQDDNGHGYRVSRFRTREEAERVAERFESGDAERHYRVERIDSGAA